MIFNRKKNVKGSFNFSFAAILERWQEKSWILNFENFIKNHKRILAPETPSFALYLNLKMDFDLVKKDGEGGGGEEISNHCLKKKKIRNESWSLKLKSGSTVRLTLHKQKSEEGYWCPKRRGRGKEFRFLTDENSLKNQKRILVTETQAGIISWSAAVTFHKKKIRKWISVFKG